MADRTVTTVLKAKVDGYVSGVKKSAAATAELNKRTKAAMKQQELLGKAAGLVGAGIALYMGKQMVGAASDLQESMSKVGVVFGKNSREIIEWSKNAATGMGMSQQAALEASGTFGNLFTAMKIASPQAAVMSRSMVQLAADLASFNNVNPEDALLALRSGLTGEIEPLRRFGVNLTDATLKAKALELGLISGKVNALDPASKAQAAYALILEQTQTAQGDFARTSDGLANSQRIVAAQWEDLQAKLGEALLPAVELGTKAFSKLLDIINAAPGPLRTIGLVLAVLGGAFLALAPRIVATRAAMKELGITATGTAPKLRMIGTAGVVAVAGLTAFINAQQNARAAAEAFSDTLDAQTGAMTAETYRRAAQEFTKNFSLEDLRQTPFTLEQIITAVAEGGAAIDDLRAKVKAWGDESVKAAGMNLIASNQASEAAHRLDNSIGFLNTDLTAGKEIWGAAAKATDAYSAATGQAASTTDTAADAADDLAEKAKKLTDALDKLHGKQISVDKATDNLKASFDAATEALKDNGKTTDNNTEKGRANRDALRDIADAAFDAIDAYVDAGKSTEFVTGKTKLARDAFVDVARKMGMSKTEAENLAKAYGLIPGKVKTTIDANITSAMAKLQTLADKLREVTGMSYTVTPGAAGVSRGGRGSSGRGSATGGIVRGPGTKMSDSVDMRLSRGEYVVRADAVDKVGVSYLDALNSGKLSRAQTGSYGGSGVTIGNVTVTVSNPGATSAQVAAAVQDGIVDAARAMRRARHLVGA